MSKIYFFLLAGCVSLQCTQQVMAQAAPGGVSTNNTLWLKANTGTTLNANNQVTVWSEQSGAGITGDFSTQGAAINMGVQNPPTLLDAGINFNPYIVFSTANSNSISSNNAFVGTTMIDDYDNTLFQVFKIHSMSGTGVWFKWQYLNTNAQRMGCEINNGGVNANKMRFDFRGLTTYTTTTVTNKNVIATSSTNQNNAVIRLNGATDATQAFGFQGAFNPGTTQARITLGNEEYGDPYPTTVDIAEEILYSRTLTTQERNKVESYLAVKYGFTLAQTGIDANDYIASNGTITWDHTANAAFAGNITGIGRDDASGLSQKQSLSINDDAMVTIYHGMIAGTFPITNDANTNSFSSDFSFLLFGTNLDDTALNQCSADGTFLRMARIWKTQVTGTPATVTLSLKKANVSSDIKSLIIASDAGFNTNVQVIPLIDNGTELYAAANLPNNSFFSFGSQPLSLNGQTGPVVCGGANGTVTLSPTGGLPPLSYNWNSNPPQTGQNLGGVPAGTYTVTVTQAHGCSFSASYTIAGSPNPIYIKVTDTQNTICTTPNGAISVSALGGQPTYQFKIDNGSWSSSSEFTGLTTGSHVIGLRDANNCETDTSILLTNYTYALEVSDTSEDAWCDAGGLGGMVRIIINNGARPYQYLWQNLPDGHGAEMNNLPPGNYTILVSDKYGCVGQVSAEVGEQYCCSIWMPSAFSPNNDGLNDQFKPQANRNIPRFEMSIYNRWGQRIFYTRKLEDGWNGLLDNARHADPGTYLYFIRYTCERGNQQITLKGDLSLIR
jgi:gliding motility-associated-like protein